MNEKEEKAIQLAESLIKNLSHLLEQDLSEEWRKTFLKSKKDLLSLKIQLERAIEDE